MPTLQSKTTNVILTVAKYVHYMIWLDDYNVLNEPRRIQQLHDRVGWAEALAPQSHSQSCFTSQSSLGRGLPSKQGCTVGVRDVVGGHALPGTPRHAAACRAGAELCNEIPRCWDPCFTVHDLVR